MNLELISLVLSLLSNIQIQPGDAAAPKIEAIYASWVSTSVVTYACPDMASGIDPMGQTMVVSDSRSTCDDAGCHSVAVAMPVTVYPKSLTCHDIYRAEHKRIFESKLAAGQFLLDCPVGQCQEWKIRGATEDEVVEWALALRKWKVTHYPGGDAYSYPNGVFEIYPSDERTFGEPLGQGKSALAAVAAALKGTTRG